MENEEGPKQKVRRYGNFKIARDLAMEDNVLSLLPIMAGVFVIRCEFMYEDYSFHYTAISQHFDDLSEGEITPQYEAEITRHEDKTITVKWERV